MPDRYPNTATFSNDVTGECYVPDVFADDLRLVTAALDWARTWNTRQDFRMTAQELRSAADAAESLAREARAFADAAEENIR